MLSPGARAWANFLEGFQVAKPCRLTLLLAIAVPAIFIWVDQAAEVLRCLAEGQASRGRLQRFQFPCFFGSLAVFSFYAWYSTRVLLYLKFPHSPPPTAVTRFVRLHLPRFVGLIPPVGLGIAYWLGSQSYPAGAGPRIVMRWHALACVLLGIVFSVFFAVRHGWLNRRKSAESMLDGDLSLTALPKATKVAVTAMFALAAVLLLVFVATPPEVPQAVGSAAIILLAAASWVCAISAANYVTGRFQVPVVFLVLVAVTFFSLWNDNHLIRVLPQKTRLPMSDLTERFGQWAQKLEVACTNESRHPVFIVATEGGGIRAAFWTALILTRLQEANPRFASHLYASSGVSGGSLGAVVFNALLATGSRTNLSANAQSMLSRDFLAPVLAAMLYPDLVQRFLPFPIPRWDRARALEMAWEDAWHDTVGNDLLAGNFLDLWRGPSGIPDLYLNGTSVEFGKRVITSNVPLDEGNFVDIIDAAGKLNGDIRASTAAHMSARFTYVSPAGRFSDGERVVDGGYFENSGAATADDVAYAASKLVKTNLDLYLILISNNPDTISSSESPNKRHEMLSEVLAPIQTLLKTREARGSYSEIMAEIEPYLANNFRFSLTARSTPLPLGWQLSQGAAQEMVTQLREQEPTVQKIIGLLPSR